jgi:hypothetical protein
MMSSEMTGHSSSSSSYGVVRLNNIKGYSNRTNNVIYMPPAQRCTNNNKDEPHEAIIYFGGDVQDIPEMMEENRDTKGYVKFNLDHTAMILQEAFPHAHIVVVRPVR